MGKGEGAKNKTSRQATTGTADVKIGMAKMLKGGVIMDVIDAEQARLNVRVGPCGTMGCQLHDNHAGPHLFAAPVGPRARKAPRRAEYVVST